MTDLLIANQIQLRISNLEGFELTKIKDSDNEEVKQIRRSDDDVRELSFLCGTVKLSHSMLIDKPQDIRNFIVL